MTVADTEAALLAADGDRLARSGCLAEGADAFRAAALAAPDHPDYLQAALALYSAAGQAPAALELLDRFPARLDTLVARSILLLDLGHPDAALAVCDGGLLVFPDDFVLRLNRGAALRQFGRLEDACVNDAELVRRHPGQAIAHYNLGDALLALHRWPEALDAMAVSCECDPSYVPSHMGRGLALSMLRRFHEAEQAFARARSIDPAAANAYMEQARLAAGAAEALPIEPRAIFLSMALKAQQVCDWRERSHLEGLLRELFGPDGGGCAIEQALAFGVLLLDLPHDIQRAVARETARQAQASVSGASPAFCPARVRGSKLRIGYLSPDFRPHPVVETHWRQMQLHDRSQFEVWAYSLYDAGPSPERERITVAADRYIDLSQFDVATIARRIAADGIDILVDLSGYTEHTRPAILACRPAPVQAAYLGSPGPIGGGLVDYRLTDKVLTPESEAGEWDEHLVWLPDTFMIGDDTLIAGYPATRDGHGLPESGFVFCCFNTHHKFDPASFDVWMRLLRDISGSVLWLAQGSEASSRNLLAEAAARGIGADRLVFARRLPMPEHLARHACADLFLDTPNYSANVTAMNALRSGLPILTLRGRNMPSRMGASVVIAAGIPEMVVDSLGDYEALARRLAAQPEALASVRERLRAGIERGPLLDTERRVRHIEAAYREMWQRYEAGLPPASFAVAP